LDCGSRGWQRWTERAAGAVGTGAKAIQEQVVVIDVHNAVFIQVAAERVSARDEAAVAVGLEGEVRLGRDARFGPIAATAGIAARGVQVGAGDGGGGLVTDVAAVGGEDVVDAGAADDAKASAGKWKLCSA
jgi:hypothetical protein